MPSLIDDVLKQPGHCVDNVFASGWKGLNFGRLIQRSVFRIQETIRCSRYRFCFLLVLRKWIDVSSIAVFDKQSLKVFSEAKKSVMYELLKHADVDGRGFNTNVAKNRMKYRIVGSKGQVEAFDANVLYYHKVVKGEWKSSRHALYWAVTMDVELDMLTRQ